MNGTVIKQKSIQSFFKVLSATKNVETTPPNKRQKTDLVGNAEVKIPLTGGASLSPEQKSSIEEKKIRAKIKLLSKTCLALSDNIGPSWFFALENQFQKEYFKKLGQFISVERSKYTIFPPQDEVYSWTRMCAIEEVKVVILGQDPYHGAGQAHGLAFSVKNGVKPPPSLQNMFKELEQDIEGFEIPKHGNLSGWASQGVLLLNACLTVQSGKPNSHKDRGWENLTDAVIKYISDNLDNVVFLLWGSYAHKKGEIIDKRKHHVLKTVHPSPLSVRRGFFGCKHFSQANELLIEAGKEPINWKHLPVD